MSAVTLNCGRQEETKHYATLSKAKLSTNRSSREG